MWLFLGERWCLGPWTAVRFCNFGLPNGAGCRGFISVKCMRPIPRVSVWSAIATSKFHSPFPPFCPFRFFWPFFAGANTTTDRKNWPDSQEKFFCETCSIIPCEKRWTTEINTFSRPQFLSLHMYRKIEKANPRWAIRMNVLKCFRCLLLEWSFIDNEASFSPFCFIPLFEFFSSLMENLIQVFSLFRNLGFRRSGFFRSCPFFPAERIRKSLYTIVQTGTWMYEIVYNIPRDSKKTKSFWE